MSGLYPDDPQLPSGEKEVGLGADGKFTSGDPATGALPSRLPASHLNLMTDLLQRAIEDLSLTTVNNTDTAQLKNAVLKAIADRTQAIYSKVGDPTPSDDSTQGYKIGDRWINSTSSETLILIDATAGAAKWVDTSLTVDEIIPLIDVKLDKAGDTMTANLAMSNNKITGLANGTVANDAVNKGQLDAATSASGLSAVTLLTPRTVPNDTSSAYALSDSINNYTLVSIVVLPYRRSLSRRLIHTIPVSMLFRGGAIGGRYNTDGDNINFFRSYSTMNSNEQGSVGFRFSPDGRTIYLHHYNFGGIGVVGIK